MYKRLLLFGSLAATLFLGTAFTVTTNDKYFEIIKNIEIFTNAYKELNTNYVDEIDPGQLMRTGLEAMVGSLDPFTNYISEADIEGYRFQTEGRYRGIGAKSEQIGEYITITELYRGQPADQAGLKPGDQIISVDGQSAVGRTLEEMESVMRGFPGTTMNLVIRRPGLAEEMTITLTRGEVEVPNVPYLGMLQDDIGYINLSVFSQQASRNVANALRDLKAQTPKLKGLVLDLRGNGGGLLAEAINLCNIFIPRGEVVVTTRGKVKDWDRVYKTQNQPIDTEIPLVVLINKNSASASEIVSGVMQDYDRGVLIGQRSYGKGLVQNTMDIGYNARVKITTAKYYIPSERCIQSVEYENGEPKHIPDDQRARFKTRNGRVVLDGGGIKPDILLDPLTDDGIVKALLDEFIIFDYVTQWVQQHPTIDSVDVFNFTDFADFESYLDKRKFQYNSEAEKVLADFKAKAEAEGLDVKSEVKRMEASINAAQQAELNRYRNEIIDLIEKEIVGRYYYQRGKVQMGLRNDEEVSEAIKLLNDTARYQAILSGSGE
ncbi:MAG: S41 family peptidase [Bacteroidetes bacterium]|nr:MAG: S41 family peptidase [Bacteroidota bacterium]